jgi:riboflavin kinase/FMN adenylyltransferase
MLILRDDFTPFQGQSVLTIGKFDGLHLGHQRLLATIRQRAEQQQAQSVVVTFDPHPAAVLSPAGAPPLLTPLPEKLALLEALGINATALIHFRRETAAIRALDFLAWLQRDLRPREIWVGPDFAFGYKREGTVALLREWGEQHGVGIGTVEAITGNGEMIAGSTLRQLLAAGDVATVAAQLGRPYTLAGTVVQGDQRGRTIGIPTANLSAPPEKARPANGVYVTLAEIGGTQPAPTLSASPGQYWPAVTNVGVRPTVDGTRQLVETYLLDWSGNLYDQPLQVHFLQHLRPEQKFNSFDALVSQIHRDVQAARDWFATHPAPIAEE